MEKKEAPNALAVALVLLAHGAFLAGCGYHGAAQSDFAPKAMHSFYAGAGGGAVLALCGIMTMAGSYRLYMIGVHIALLLQLLFVVVFSVQAFRSHGVPEKEDRFLLFVEMGLGSVVALVLMVLFKPKKAKKD